MIVGDVPYARRACAAERRGLWGRAPAARESSRNWSRGDSNHGQTPISCDVRDSAGGGGTQESAARRLARPYVTSFEDLRRGVGIFNGQGGTIGWLVNADGILIIGQPERRRRGRLHRGNRGAVVECDRHPDQHAPPRRSRRRQPDVPPGGRLDRRPREQCGHGSGGRPSRRGTRTRRPIRTRPSATNGGRRSGTRRSWRGVPRPPATRAAIAW